MAGAADLAKRPTLDPLGPVPWLEVLETGWSAVDEAHHRLVDHANALLELLERDRDRTDVAAMAAVMRADCVAHFREEEKIMAAAGFAGVMRHRAEHLRIEREICGIADGLRSAAAPSHLHILVLAFRGLLLDHLLRYDLSYKSHLMNLQGR